VTTGKKIKKANELNSISANQKKMVNFIPPKNNDIIGWL
jgi:hypothetical protein